MWTSVLFGTGRLIPQVLHSIIPLFAFTRIPCSLLRGASFHYFSRGADPVVGGLILTKNPSFRSGTIWPPHSNNFFRINTLNNCRGCFLFPINNIGAGVMAGYKKPVFSLRKYLHILRYLLHNIRQLAICSNCCSVVLST